MSATTTAPVEAPVELLIDLHRLAAGVRWHRRVWGSLALVGALLGGGLALLLPSSATAATRIYVVHDDGGSDSEAAMKTDLAVLETTTVAGAAVNRLRIDVPPDRFVDTFVGEVVAGNILEVTAYGPTDQQAVDRVQAVADAFIAVHVKRSDDAAKADSAALVKRRNEVQVELDEVNAQVDADPAAAGSRPLLDRRSSLSQQVGELSQRAEDAYLGSPRVAAGTQIIDAPRVTSRSALVSLVLFSVIGTVLGLGIGLGLAAVATVVRDRPVLRRDIAAHVGASVIAQLPAAPVGPSRLWRRSRAEVESRRTAATLVRTVQAGRGPVSLLELGCPKTAARLATEIAGELAATHPVVIVDDLPGDELRDGELAEESGVTLVPGSDFPGSPPRAAQPDERLLAVGTVGPGTPWTDLRRLGAETLLIIQAGRAEASWLHTVARQLADAGISVIGVVVVHPDPRDRSDGTLWDALNTAVRGRLEAARAVLPSNGEVPASKVTSNGHRSGAIAGAPDDSTAALVPVGVGAMNQANVLPVVHPTVPARPVDQWRPAESPPAPTPVEVELPSRSDPVAEPRSGQGTESSAAPQPDAGPSPPNGPESHAAALDSTSRPERPQDAEPQLQAGSELSVAAASPAEPEPAATLPAPASGEPKRRPRRPRPQPRLLPPHTLGSTPASAPRHDGEDWS